MDGTGVNVCATLCACVCVLRCVDVCVLRCVHVCVLRCVDVCVLRCVHVCVCYVVCVCVCYVVCMCVCYFVCMCVCYVVCMCVCYVVWMCVCYVVCMCVSYVVCMCVLRGCQRGCTTPCINGAQGWVAIDSVCITRTVWLQFTHCVCHQLVPAPCIPACGYTCHATYPILCIGVRLRVQQQLHHLSVSIEGSHVQGGPFRLLHAMVVW
jgi:hypothetical protein